MADSILVRKPLISKCVGSASSAITAIGSVKNCGTGIWAMLKDYADGDSGVWQCVNLANDSDGMSSSFNP